jgi:hypothetical protein
MTDLTMPRDELAERAVIGQCLALAAVPAEVSALIGPQDVWHPAVRVVAETCWDLTARDAPCDPVAVRTELLRRGERGQAVDAVWLVELMQSGQPGAAYHARHVRDMAVRREVLVEATRAAQAAGNPGADPYEVAASLYAHAAVLAERGDPQRVEPLEDVHAFAAGPTEFDWLVPGLLERGDRLLLSGGEGSGKSVATRQIAVTTAAGLNPWTGDRFDPRRVVLVDLENGTRHLRRALRPLIEHAHTIGRPVPKGGLTVESRPSGIDLTRPDDEAWLTRLCAQAQPDLLVVGPLYRMHATDMAKEEPARHLTRVLDSLRARHGCALVVETHAGHGSGIGVRDLRPVGSSLFRRWPEFGYGLRPKDDEGAVMRLVAWRGARDERDWPAELRRGGPGEWPWAPYQTYRWSEDAS